MKKQTLKGVASAFLLSIGLLATGCGSNSGDLDDGITTLSYPVKMDEGTSVSVDLKNGSVAKVDPNAIPADTETDGIVPDSGVADGGEEPPVVDPTTGEPVTEEPTGEESTVTAPSEYAIKTQPLHGMASLSGSRLIYTPDAGWFGADKVYIEKGTTELLDYARITVTFTVVDVPDENVAPTIGGIPESVVVVGANYSFTPIAKDANGDPLTFSIKNKPLWATFDKATGKLSGTAPLAENIYTDIIISVTDGLEVASLSPFSIDVQIVNQAPSISGTPETLVGSGYDYSFIPRASDLDGDPIEFSAINVPAWATFDTVTGELSGITPNISEIYPDITIRVTDGVSETTLAPFTINVENRNHAPTISGIADSPVDINTAYSFIPKATDVDGDTLVFSIANLPTWASFNPNTGEISGTTPAFNRTYSNIILDVTDGIETVALSPFSIVVESLNNAPVLGGAPTTTIKAGETYGFTPSSSDADGDTLTFGISNKPHWATFDSLTGTLSGIAEFATDVAGEPLIYTVTIYATDGTDTTYMAPFDLEVTP